MTDEADDAKTDDARENPSEANDRAGNPGETKPDGRDDEGDEDDDDDGDATALTAIVLKFLATERGHSLANRVIDLIDGFKRATLGAQAKSTELNGTIAKLHVRQTFWLQTLGLITVVGAIVWLSANNNLKAEASTILGAVAGYLFAQRSKVGS